MEVAESPSAGRRGRRDGELLDVDATLWRALAVLRFVTLAHAVALDTYYWDRYTERLAGWLVITGVAVWTLIATWAYESPRRRTWPVLTADVLVAIGALLANPYIEEPGLLETQATVASYWVVAPILAWAIHRGWVAGVLSAVVVSVADLSMRLVISGTVIGNVFLMLLSAAVVGYLSTLLRETVAERARVTALAAQTAERERLARAVHDGVLQVLAYVQRRGPDLGPEGARLARAAGEQEARLRALVQGKPIAEPGDPPHGDADGRVDVARMLSQNVGPDVSVAAPAGEVLLDHDTATELIAAVGAALDNAEKHAPGARVFVLLEADEDTVTISVRDDGPGIADGRLAEAAADGRMGVSRSIVGRLADLGGTAQLTTEPGRGTEWELRVPRG